MNTAAKLLKAMRHNPLDWRIEQLQTVARQHGVEWRHDGTSHCVFIRTDEQLCQYQHIAPSNRSM